MNKPKYFRAWYRCRDGYGSPILIEGNFQLAPLGMEVWETLRCGNYCGREKDAVSIWPSCNKGRVADNTPDCYYIPTSQEAREYCKKCFPDWCSKLPNANQHCQKEAE